MSDHEQTVLDRLIPKRRFSQDEWVTLITSRLERIKPHLRDFTLEVLGEKMFVPYAEPVILHEVYRSDIPFDGSFDTDDMLRSQGLFFAVPRNDALQWDYDRRVVGRPAWGLLRNGTLILITLTYSIVGEIQKIADGEYAGGGVGELGSVTIEPTDVEEIVRLYPDDGYGGDHVGCWQLLQKIREKVDEYVNRRWHLYQSANALHQQFKSEDALLTRAGAHLRNEVTNV